MEGNRSVFKCSFPNRSDWVSGKLVAVDSNANLTIQPFQGESRKYKLREQAGIAFELPDSEVNLGVSMQAAEYVEMVCQAKEQCKSELSKVVLSRNLDIATNEVDVNEVLLKLRTSFPSAFVYALKTEEDGLWIGASPEVLVRKSKNQFQTVSLAGTRWENDDFTEKERIEQSVVTQSILDDLSLSLDHASEPKEVRFGSIRHLESKIKWQSLESLSDISKKLHPTPAVCGLPKKAALQFINELEVYDRKLYTGYLQLEGIAEDDISFVNLRCMQLFRDHIRFYIGGGINSMSHPESEWIETEKKLETLLDAIKLDR